MRRVTLANPDVRRTLREHFVCCWSDSTGDPEAGVSFAHDPKEAASRRLARGNGEHNLQVLFLTPKGEILHAVAGYSKPKDFLGEIAFARKVHDAALAPGVDRAAVVGAMQRIAARDARRRPDAVPWGPDVVVLGREFVAKHPLLPASEYRPSLIFGPGGGVFFGVGRSKHGLLGEQHPPTPPVVAPPPAPPPEDPVAAFVRRASEEWRPVRVEATTP